MYFSARSGTPRRRAPLRGLLVPGAIAVVAVALPLAAAPSPASAGTVTAAAVIKESKAAIAKQTGAHLEFNASSTTSTATEKIVADVGDSSGAETITDGSAALHVRVTSKDGYISGSASGLTSLFGMTSAEATKVGKRWEFWKSGTTQYKDLKSGVTVHSLESLFPKSAGTTVSTKGANYVLAWTSAASSSTPKLNNTLSIAAKGSNLPVQEISTDSAGEKITTTISKWGEAVAVQSPAAGSTIPASKITG
jgi:hypothetical protein